MIQSMTFGCHIFLVFLNLGQFLSFSFKILIVLKSIGQLLCRMPLNLNYSDGFSCCFKIQSYLFIFFFIDESGRNFEFYERGWVKNKLDGRQWRFSLSLIHLQRSWGIQCRACFLLRDLIKSPGACSLETPEESVNSVSCLSSVQIPRFPWQIT